MQNKTKSKKVLKDPKGGLTAAGRAAFAKSEGAHLKPGVRGKADTPEKMKRKGSFLRRHFANLRGPLQDEKGKPTRLALSAHAWGEAVPKTAAAAKKLAAKGAALLERYRSSKSKGETGKASGGPGPRKGAVTKKKKSQKKAAPAKSKTSRSKKKTTRKKISAR